MFFVGQALALLEGTDIKMEWMVKQRKEGPGGRGLMAYKVRQNDGGREE